MKGLKLKGTFVVAATPFTSEDKLDEKGLRGNIDWYIKQGIHGVVCNGSTSEFISLSEDEWKKVVDITLDQVNQRVPVLVGTCGPTTKDTIEKTKYAKKAGADGALIVQPYYHRPNEEELYTHYKRIAEAVDIPIMIYNNPSATMIDMLPELLTRLAKDFGNIAYVKETSGQLQRVQELINLAGNNMSVFCGDDTMAFESLLLGAKGWVAASANLIPNKCAKLFELMEKGNIAEARDLWFKIVPLTSSVEGWGRLVQTIKKGLDLLGRAGGPSPRGPKLGIKKEQEVELKRMLTQLGELS